MENSWLLFLGIVVGLLAGTGIGWAISHRQARDVLRFREELKSAAGDQVMDAVRKATEQLGTSAAQLLDGKLRLGELNLESRKADIDKSLQSVREGLLKVETLVTSYEKDRADKFGALQNQLKVTAEQTGRLQQTTDRLREALANSSARGQWGERMADAVLRASGMQEGINYFKQSSTEEGRPDFAIMLPNKLKLHMDVKFPMKKYSEYLENTDEKVREGLLKQFLSDVRDKVNQVARKDYIDPANGTVDQAVMFIPNESVYGFVCEHDPEFVNEALGKKVIPCSPMTLYAVLLVINQSVESFNIARRRDEIIDLVRAFGKEWDKFTALMDRVGKKISDTHEEYDQLANTRERALRKQVDRIQLLTDGAAPSPENPARLESDK